MGKPIFTLITKDNCPWCFRAKQELAKADYKFKVQQIGKDISLKEIKIAYPTQDRVPIVLIQDDEDAPRQILGSYDELMEYLDGNGAKDANSGDTHGNDSKEANPQDCGQEDG